MEGEERRCRLCYEKRETIEHMWNRCSEIRERKGKEIWKRRERIETERGEGWGLKRFFLEFLRKLIFL
jgi:hypothetical protein